MKVTFNQNDFNLEKIKLESKLFSLRTNKSYYVYGLKQEDNPPIHLGTGEISHARKIGLNNFFQTNNIGIQIEGNDEKLPWKDYSTINIGLRRDLRNNPILCAAIVNTLVYYLEGRLTLAHGYKLQKIPKFS